MAVTTKISRCSFAAALCVAVIELATSATAWAQKTSLWVYTALETDAMEVYKDAFEKANPDIEVKWVRDSTGIVTAKLLAEKANPQADVVTGLAAKHGHDRRRAHRRGNSAEAPAALELVGIRKDFESFSALRDVHLRVNSGEMRCFPGRSGRGKTTLLRIIAELETQAAGQILQNGQNISRWPPTGATTASCSGPMPSFPISRSPRASVADWSTPAQNTARSGRGSTNS